MLINFCTFFALIMTTKLSGAVMVFIFFRLLFSSIMERNTNKILLLLLLTTSFHSLIYENFKINNQLFFDVPPQEEYQDRPI